VDKALILGNWSGIPTVLITLILGMALFVIVYVVVSRIDKMFTPHLIIGLTIGVLMAIMSMNLKVVSIVLNGHIFPLVISSLFFPVLALSTDVLNEFYGKKYAKALLNGSIVTQTVMFVLMFWFVEIPSETIEIHSNFIHTFAMATRGFIAGAVAMYVGTLVNIHIFCFFRKLTQGKKMWGRLLSSTNAGLLLDIVLYTSILFVGTRSLSEIFKMMFISAIVRVTFSFLEVPVMYLLRWLKGKRIFIVEVNVPIYESAKSHHAVGEDYDVGVSHLRDLSDCLEKGQIPARTSISVLHTSASYLGMGMTSTATIDVEETHSIR
jgi:hypothetical protein